ncbi:minor capsid protein [Methylobacterium sp. AMS5]|uniref:phage tail terminator protein n=1 Tax=Methylobacterium sp. AMS5 TaxID=925818 RepID=UPI00074F9804|nr:minor capsid protein [Methylobacterium sp. AMS5]AMB48263.1 hypothetical protein Y590_25180 [Methylobacterium sp. AMS5]
MRIDCITDYLAAEGLGTVGKDLFEHEMPANTKVGILLRTPLEGIKICHELPGYYRGRALQAIVRAQKDETGWPLAGRLSKALTLYKREFKDSEGRLVMRINHLLPQTLPITYRRSDGNGKEWSINLDASYVLL